MWNKDRTNLLVCIFIILLAISPAFALGAGNRNLLLIGAMALSPMFLLIYPGVLGKVDFPLIALCLMMMFFPYIRHADTMRWSTVLYSCMFCLYFMSYVRVLYHSSFTLNDFLRLLKGLLFAYCIVLLIQQFCVLTGLPIFNVSNYTLLQPWKLNSLTAEPSHSARNIPIIMYIYILGKEYILGRSYDIKKDFADDRWVWLAFLWPVLTMGSATAFLFLFIVMLKVLKWKTFLFLLLVSVLMGGTVSFFSDSQTIGRTIKFTKAVLTFDEKEMIRADHSASGRIVPSFIAAKKISMNTLDGWFGHGVDADQKLPKIPGYPTANAGAFYMWYNFGFIAALVFWIFTFYICYNRSDYVSVLIWLFSVFIVGGLNNQILWLVLTLQFTYKYIIKDGVINTYMENIKLDDR